MSHRVLITGSRGFVGRHLVPTLTTRLPQSEVHALNCDITHDKAVADEVAALRPDVCIHLAAVAAITLARQDPDRTWRVNLHGTLNLAKAVLTHAPACTFLFISSADAYGASFRLGNPVDESAPLAPLNVYGATKAAADLALGALAASDGLRAVRLRAFNQVGPGQSADYALPAFARQIARVAAGRQEPVLRVGALDPMRDFLDVRDVCAAYVECVARAPELAPGMILNIASGSPRRIGDALDALIAEAGISVHVETEATRLRPSDIPVACGDASRARALLGWTPRIPWEQSIRDVLLDWRARVAAETE